MEQVYYFWLLAAAGFDLQIGKRVRKILEGVDSASSLYETLVRCKAVRRPGAQSNHWALLELQGKYARQSYSNDIRMLHSLLLLTAQVR